MSELLGEELFILVAYSDPHSAGPKTKLRDKDHCHICKWKKPAGIPEELELSRTFEGAEVLGVDRLG